MGLCLLYAQRPLWSGAPAPLMARVKRSRMMQKVREGHWKFMDTNGSRAFCSEALDSEDQEERKYWVDHAVCSCWSCAYDGQEHDGGRVSSR